MRRRAEPAEGAGSRDGRRRRPNGRGRDGVAERHANNKGLGGDLCPHAPNCFGQLATGEQVRRAGGCSHLNNNRARQLSASPVVVGNLRSALQIFAGRERGTSSRRAPVSWCWTATGHTDQQQKQQRRDSTAQHRPTPAARRDQACRQGLIFSQRPQPQLHLLTTTTHRRSPHNPAGPPASWRCSPPPPSSSLTRDRLPKFRPAPIALARPPPHTYT